MMEIDFFMLPNVLLEARQHLPAESGVYLAYDEAGTALYIGKSGNMRNRWQYHHKLSEVSACGAVRIGWLLIKDPDEMSRTECALVEQYKPRFNVATPGEPPRNPCPVVPRGITLRVKEILAEREKSLYWLAKESGVPYKTLLKWRDDALDSFDRSVLDRVATALKCQPGDLLTHTPEN